MSLGSPICKNQITQSVDRVCTPQVSLCALFIGVLFGGV